MKKRLIRPKVLYIGDKWCSGNINFGISEWETNIWKSLESTKLANLKVFHFDDYYYKFNKLGDNALINKIKRFKPDIICLVIYRPPGSDFNVPKWETFNKIKNDFKIPIMAVWGDLEIIEQIKIFKSLLSFTTINAATASSAAIKRINNPKCIYMWVPKDPNVFNNPAKKRDINVSYAGSIKGDRLRRIKKIISDGIPVYYAGGEREEHLTTAEYADVFKRSKITLSFSRAHYSHVVNARPFEAMTCGTMVLEEESFELPKLFIPYVDYVPFTNEKDLLKKIKYYLSHEKERKQIAKNGYEKMSRLYTAKRFWQLLINRALKTSNQNTNYLFKIKESNLSHLSFLTRFKLKFLNTLCSNRLGFRIYRTTMIIVRKEDWGTQTRTTLFPAYLFFQKRLSSENFEKILKLLRYIFRIKKRN